MKRWTVRVKGWRLGRWGEAEWVSHHWTRAGAELRLRLITALINSVGGGYTTALSRDELAPRPDRENLLARIKAARANQKEPAAHEAAGSFWFRMASLRSGSE